MRAPAGRQLRAATDGRGLQQGFRALQQRSEASLQPREPGEILGDQCLLVGGLDSQPGVHEIGLRLALHVGHCRGDLGGRRRGRPVVLLGSRGGPV